MVKYRHFSSWGLEISFPLLLILQAGRVFPFLGNTFRFTFQTPLLLILPSFSISLKFSRTFLTFSSEHLEAISFSSASSSSIVQESKFSVLSFPFNSILFCNSLDTSFSFFWSGAILTFLKDCWKAELIAFFHCLHCSSNVLSEVKQADRFDDSLLVTSWWMNMMSYMKHNWSN